MISRSAPNRQPAPAADLAERRRAKECPFEQELRSAWDRFQTALHFLHGDLPFAIDLSIVHGQRTALVVFDELFVNRFATPMLSRGRKGIAMGDTNLKITGRLAPGISPSQAGSMSADELVAQIAQYDVITQDFIHRPGAKRRKDGGARTCSLIRPEERPNGTNNKQRADVMDACADMLETAVPELGDGARVIELPKQVGRAALFVVSDGS